MKKIVALLLAMTLMLGIAACSAEELAGGWQAEGSWCPAVSIAEEDMAPFTQAMEGFVGVSYEVLGLIGKQIVAGTNYCYLTMATTVTLEPAHYYALVYVYQDLSGTCSVLDIQPLTIGVE